MMNNKSSKPGSSYRNLLPEQFLQQCRLEVFRGSGPGGQKRNKTSSAVRLVHLPTGITATASEFRSQNQNRTAALSRLRHRVAMEIREPFVARNLSLDISMRAADYLLVMAWVLDALHESEWSVSVSARILGSNTAPLAAFLRRDEILWGYVNQQRLNVGLKSLIG
jgi:RF-1 domain